jgi:hypothetical protein
MCCARCAVYTDEMRRAAGGRREVVRAGGEIVDVR